MENYIVSSKDFAPPHSSCWNNADSVLSLLCSYEAFHFLWNSQIKEIKYPQSAITNLLQHHHHHYHQCMFITCLGSWNSCFFSRTLFESCICLLLFNYSHKLTYCAKFAWPLEIHTLGNFSFFITIPVPWTFRLVRWQQHSSHSVLYGDSYFTCMLILLNYYYKKMR